MTPELDKEEAVEHICGLPEFGSYGGQVVLVAPLWLRERWPDGIGIDVCLALEIQSLWRAGIKTNGHCCGHSRAPAYIGVWPESVEAMRTLGYLPVDGRSDHFTPKSLKPSDGWRWISAALRQRLETLSTREIAKQVGRGHATIARVAKGKEPLVSTYFTLVRWLATSPAAKEAECEALRKEVEKWTADFRYQFDRAEAAEQKLEAEENHARIQAEMDQICIEQLRETVKACDAANDINISAWRVQREALEQKLDAAERALKLLAQSANSVALEFVGRLPPKHSIWGDLKNARRALASEDSAE